MIDTVVIRKVGSVKGYRGRWVETVYIGPRVPVGFIDFEDGELCITVLYDFKVIKKLKNELVMMPLDDNEEPTELEPEEVEEQEEESKMLSATGGFILKRIRG